MDPRDQNDDFREDDDYDYMDSERETALAAVGWGLGESYGRFSTDDYYQRLIMVLFMYVVMVLNSFCAISCFNSTVKAMFAKDSESVTVNAAIMGVNLYCSFAISNLIITTPVGVL